jgi:transposase
MSQSRTRFVGMDVHKETLAVAYVAHEPGAAVPSFGTIGTRQCASDTLLRTRQAKAHHLMCISEAGPCGSWRSRSLQQKGDDCWVVAPSLMPQKAGERGTTDRRDAVQLAR